MDPDVKKLVAREIERCEEFAALARNRAAPNGPFSLINEMKFGFLC